MRDLFLLMERWIISACFRLDFDWLTHLLIQSILYWEVDFSGFVSPVTIREWSEDVIIFCRVAEGDGGVAGDKDSLA